jgi:uncharacterized protein (DUF983 family)
VNPIPERSWSDVVEKPNALVVLARGFLKRCPRCGRGHLFTGWFSMREQCPRCGLAFERGEGYWLGAIAVNLGATEALFGAMFVAIIVATWPNVPWVWPTIAGIALNIVVPIAFYPFSKTIFVAIDLLLIHAEERSWLPDQEPLPAASPPPLTR